MYSFLNYYYFFLDKESNCIRRVVKRAIQGIQETNLPPSPRLKQEKYSFLNYIYVCVCVCVCVCVRACVQIAYQI